jgi:uncharacterized protein (TIGR02145 family)
MKKKYLLMIPLFILLFSCASNQEVDVIEEEIINEIVTDADGNVYTTVKIGNQTWMVENLKTTKYNDGSPITLYTFEDFGSNWGSLNNKIGHYQWASTEDLNNVVDEELPFDYYGAMYNHFAIESGKLAPSGWRIPSQEDFKELELFIANDGNAGNEATVLKTETGWLPSTGGGSNLYGFNGLPNGYVSAVGSPTLGQGICTWATSNIGVQTRVLVQLFDQKTIIYGNNAIQIGAAVRCIKE